MIDTGHTVRLAAEVLREAGAKEIYVLISHGQSCSDSLFQVGCLNTYSNSHRLVIRRDNEGA